MCNGLLLVVLAVLCDRRPVAAQVGVDPCESGTWEYFEHTLPPSPNPFPFNAVHASLIPAGLYQGKVLVWGFGHSNPGYLHWAIVDPAAQVVIHNDYIALPQAAELFCSSHAWTRDGRLFVAGGWNFQHANPPGVGSVETWIYDPSLPGFPYGLWIRQIATLERARYYPTVVADTNRNQMFVLGGGATLNSPVKTDFDDYEVFVPGPKGVLSQGAYQTRTVGMTQTQLYPGPTNDIVGALPPLVNSHRFYQYPRAYVVSTGQLVTVGMANIAARATHDPSQATIWSDLSTSGPSPAEAFRYYGSSVRFPNLEPRYEDTLMIAAGHLCVGGGCVELPTTQWCKATALAPGAWPTGHTWGPSPSLPSLQTARGCLNLVILPTAGLLALGGQTGFPPRLPAGSRLRSCGPTGHRHGRACSPIHRGAGTTLPPFCWMMPPCTPAAATFGIMTTRGSSHPTCTVDCRARLLRPLSRDQC